MMNPLMTADDVSKVLSYSRSHAYKVIGKLNQELEEKRIFDTSRHGAKEVF